MLERNCQVNAKKCKGYDQIRLRLTHNALANPFPFLMNACIMKFPSEMKHFELSQSFKMTDNL